MDSRSLAIVRTVSDLRFATSEILLPLVGEPMTGKRGRGGGFGMSALLPRLRSLSYDPERPKDGKFLRRHRLTDQLRGPGFGGPPLVYGLGPKAPLLLEEDPNQREALYQQVRTEFPKSPAFIRHELMRAKLHAWLKLAAKNNPTLLTLTDWMNHPPKFETTLDGEKKKLRPDWFTVLTGPQGNKTYFWELDNGTEDIERSNPAYTDLLTKARVYRGYYDDNVRGHSADLQKTFNALKFQVIFVFRSKTRIETLKDSIINSGLVSEESSFFRFLHMKPDKFNRLDGDTGHIDLAHPDQVFQPILSGLQDEHERYYLSG